MARNTGRITGLTPIINRVNKPAYGWTDAGFIRLFQKISFAGSTASRRSRTSLAGVVTEDTGIIRILQVHLVPITLTKISHLQVIGSAQSTVSGIRKLQRFPTSLTTVMTGKIKYFKNMDPRIIPTPHDIKSFIRDKNPFRNLIRNRWMRIHHRHIIIFSDHQLSQGGPHNHVLRIE